VPKVIACLALLASLVLSATAAAQPTPHPPGWVPVDQLPTVQSGRLGQPALQRLNLGLDQRQGCLRALAMLSLVVRWPVPRLDYLLASDDALIAQSEVDRYRASGPGGQHRNKTESAVRLRHKLSGVTEVGGLHRQIRLHCERVTIGFLRGSKVHVDAVSHSAQFKERTNLHVTLRGL